MPPKNRVYKPVRIRYKNRFTAERGVGDFFWSESERTWIENLPGPDGFALYESDGFYVVAWR